MADYFDVSRTVIREAIIMLELENLVEVRKGSGVYVIALPQRSASNDEFLDKVDVGPFELLQARQLLESSMAEFAALQVTRADITKLKDILARERNTLEQGDEDYVADEDFHRTIAEITQNEVILQMQKHCGIFVLIVKCGKVYIFIFQIRAIVTFGYKIMRILLQPYREKIL